MFGSLLKFIEYNFENKYFIKVKILYTFYKLSYFEGKYGKNVKI